MKTVTLWSYYDIKLSIFDEISVFPAIFSLCFSQLLCLNWRSFWHVLIGVLFFSNNRQVINISSDGTVESPRSPRSPRSPKKSKSPSKPRSPRSPKSSESSQRLSPKQLDTNSSEVPEQSEVNAETPTNGPVLTLEDNGNSENSETNK